MEYECLFDDMLKDDVDIKRLTERWQLYNVLDEKIKSFRKIAENDKNTIGSLNEELKHMYSQFGDYGLFHLIRLAFKKNIRFKHPKLFKFLGGK